MFRIVFISSLALAISSALAFSAPNPQTPPNYYAGLVSARDASKNARKEMIIFFSEKNCNQCEAAWNAFSKDANATDRYISTRMDVDDFDGGIFFDLLDLEKVPSWIILSPDGTEKERWEGGWKDENGKPTKFEMIALQTPIKEEIKPKATFQSTPTSSAITKPNVAAITNVNSNPTQHGFFIQAGFFSSETNAQKMRNDLTSKGISKYEIKLVQQKGRTFYRVMSSIYQSEPDAIKEQKVLSGLGFESTVKEF